MGEAFKFVGQSEGVNGGRRKEILFERSGRV